MMTMKCVCVFNLLLFAFGTTPADCELQFYESDTTLSSPADARNCTLASPPIIYNEDGMFVDDENSLIKDLLAGDKTYWIGYVQTHQAFLYKGCVNESDIISNNYRKTIKDPGICYSTCQTDIIGIQEDKCYCMKNQPLKGRLFSTHCTSQCTYPPGVLCGGIQSVSVYQKKDLVVQISATTIVGGCCLVYHPSGKLFDWYPCSSSPIVICQSDEAAKIIYNDENTPKYDQWGSAMNTCLQNQMYPINASYSPLPSEDHGPLWTGEIQSYAVFNTEDAHDIRGEKIYGFIELNRTTGKYQLRFGSPPANAFALCVKTNDGKSSQTSELKKNNKVVLYFAIPASLIVITGVVLVVLWRRGYIRVCKHTESDSDEKISTTTANTRLESKPSSEGPQHDYFVLDPQGNYDSVKNVEKQDRTEALYDRTSRFTYDSGVRVTDNSSEYFKKDDYDTTTSISKAAGIDRAMPLAYDRLSNGDTYNHIGEVKGMSAKIDDTYNQPEPKKSETMYDTTSTVSKTLKVVEYDDAMYSKVMK